MVISPVNPSCRSVSAHLTEDGPETNTKGDGNENHQKQLLYNLI